MRGKLDTQVKQIRKNVGVIAMLLANEGAVVVVRHGETDKATPDVKRRLTDYGRMQGQALRRAIQSGLVKEHVIGPVRCTVRSSAPRVDETIGGDEMPVAVPTDALYIPNDDHPMAAPLNALVKKEGLKALKDYTFTEEHTGPMQQWREEAFVAIEENVDVDALEPGCTLLVGMHAFLGPLAALGIVEAVAPDNLEVQEAIKAIHLNEGEAILLKEYNGVLMAFHLDAVALGHPTKPQPETVTA